IPELIKETVDGGHFRKPAWDIHVEKFCQTAGRDVQSAGVEIFGPRQSTDWRIDSARRSIASLKDPLQDSAVLAISRPQELAFLVLPEPVHEVNLRHLCARCLSDLQPMSKIAAHVVAAEGQHRHGIASQLADFAGSGSGRLAARRRGEK